MSSTEERPRVDLASLRIDREEEAESRFSVGRTLAWVVGLAIVAAASFFIYRRWISPRFDPLVEVVTVRATVQVDNPALLTATGYLVAHKSAKITPKISGRIKHLEFDIGSRVRGGQVLAILETRQYEAQFREAEASREAASREYNRQRSLWRQGVTARSLLDEAEAQLKVASARLDQVNVGLRDSVIRAPFDGTIISKNTELGEVVSPMAVNQGTGTAVGGGSIAMLADLSTLEVEADVNESNVGQLREGQPAEVSIDAFPDRKWRGSLRQIIPTADRAKGVVKVKVAIQNPSDRLLPEMSASASFLRTERTDQQLKEKARIWVPESAVFSSGNAPFSAVLNKENKVERRAIQTGDRREGRVEVRGGLKEGDRVVIRDGDSLKQGDHVRVEGNPS